MFSTRKSAKHKEKCKLIPPMRDQFQNNITYQQTLKKINQEISQHILPPLDVKMHFKIYSKIAIKQRHMSILIVPTGQNKYKAFQIDLTVNWIDKYWFITYNEDFSSDMKYDITQWDRVGKTNVTMGFLMNQLKVNCLEFGNYSVTTNNCQDFIEKYVNKMPNVDGRSFMTDRTSIVKISIGISLLFVWWMMKKRQTQVAPNVNRRPVVKQVLDILCTCMIIKTVRENWKGIVVTTLMMLMGQLLLDAGYEWLARKVSSASHKIVDKRYDAQDKDDQEALELRNEIAGCQI
eukprot:582309_1